jgi:hypothetical protein
MVAQRLVIAFRGRRAKIENIVIAFCRSALQARDHQIVQVARPALAKGHHVVPMHDHLVYRLGFENLAAVKA